jgi:para-nitrobenzyl esterase
MGYIVKASLFLGVVLAAALGGCRNYTETIPEKHAGDSLSGTWRLVAMQHPGAPEQGISPESTYTLEFATGDRLSGRADCNRYSGGYERAGRGRIKVLAVAATRAACPPESISDEFLRMVGAATQYEIRDMRLWLLGDDGSVLIFGR